jgi:hypothetical protein
MPVIAVAPNDSLLEKLKSNLQEVKARGGELYVFADAGSEIPESEGVHILHLPEHYGMLSPILHVIPLQLLSYHAALVKGTDVDKPRNLAKIRDGGVTSGSLRRMEHTFGVSLPAKAATLKGSPIFPQAIESRPWLKERLTCLYRTLEPLRERSFMTSTSLRQTVRSEYPVPGTAS